MYKFERIIPSDPEEKERVRVGIRDIDGEEVFIHQSDGFAATDIELFGYYFTWADIHKLISALEFAEKCWRKSNDS